LSQALLFGQSLFLQNCVEKIELWHNRATLHYKNIILLIELSFSRAARLRKTAGSRPHHLTLRSEPSFGLHKTRANFPPRRQNSRMKKNEKTMLEECK
jgi:hypothetical protein